MRRHGPSFGLTLTRPLALVMAIGHCGPAGKQTSDGFLAFVSRENRSAARSLSPVLCRLQTGQAEPAGSRGAVSRGPGWERGRLCVTGASGQAVLSTEADLGQEVP